MNIGALPLMEDGSPAVAGSPLMGGGNLFANSSEVMTRGSFGNGEDDTPSNRGNEMVAIKKIMLQGCTAGMMRRTLRELKILRLL